MKKFYLIRHGESESNLAGNIYQSSESPLTVKGREQAEYVAKRVSHLTVDTIITSPSQRANDTAEIISKKIGKPIEFSDLFVERKQPTRLAGMSRGSEEAKVLTIEWDKSIFSAGLRFEDGENFDDIKARALLALDLLAKRPEENILVITHGFFSRVVAACVLFGRELKDKELEAFAHKVRMVNTGLSMFRYNEKVKGLPWQLSVWNDHAHLADA
ncbi:MAG: histidine phosphatase family protein [Candidatus Yanofskybacteria bacterium]|nr:histidine phosphatase family protein [Candidatus Yanofskybacteria bacterium]